MSRAERLFAASIINQDDTRPSGVELYTAGTTISEAMAVRQPEASARIGRRELDRWGTERIASTHNENHRARILAAVHRFWAMHLDARANDTALVDDLQAPSAKYGKVWLGGGKQGRALSKEHDQKEDIQKRQTEDESRAFHGSSRQEEIRVRCRSRPKRLTMVTDC